MTFAQFCFSFKGRINRTLFWGCTIVSAIVIFCIFLINENAGKPGGPIIAFCSFLILLFIDITVVVKRLHDTNRSGWYCLAGLIPIIGTFYIFIMCGLIKGTDGENDYGKPFQKLT